MASLGGQHAVVTGGGRGIGAAVAEAGFRVVRCKQISGPLNPCGARSYGDGADKNNEDC